jgi:hypothetical protein
MGPRGRPEVTTASVAAVASRTLQGESIDDDNDNDTEEENEREDRKSKRYSRRNRHHGRESEDEAQFIAGAPADDDLFDGEDDDHSNGQKKKRSRKSDTRKAKQGKLKPEHQRREHVMEGKTA